MRKYKLKFFETSMSKIKDRYDFLDLTAISSTVSAIPRSRGHNRAEYEDLLEVSYGIHAAKIVQLAACGKFM